MKKLATAIGMLVALSGCAGKQSWNEYATEHQCKPTGASQLKTEVITTSTALSNQGIGMGGGSAPIPVPVTRRIFEYQCSNGIIWARI